MKKRKYSIFLVRTPLQYMIAREAQTELNIRPEASILVLFTDFKASQEQIAGLIKLDSWNRRISVFNYRNLLVSDSNIKQPIHYFSRKLRALLTIKYLLLSYRSLEYLFVGHIEDTWMRLVARHSRAKHTIFLEDGVSTLKIAENRWLSDHSKPLPILTNKFRSQFFNQNLFENIFLGKQDLVIDRIGFFTVYEKIPLKGFDYIRENNFIKLSTQYKNPNQRTVPSVWFIGQPLVERGIISKDDFIRILRAIKRKFGKHRDYYFIPHRSGKSQDFIGQEGFSIRNLSQPVEIELLRTDHIPEIIGSISSAALMNIKKLYSHELELFFVKLQTQFYADYPDHKRIADYFIKEPGFIELSE